MNTVRAAVMEKPGRLAVREFPMPDVGPGAVLMKVSYSGICGTDKHTFRGESKQYAGTAHERDLTYPLICGHENVGRVAALGGTVVDSEGRPLRIGDRIVPGANVACGRCHSCLNGHPYYFCERHGGLRQQPALRACAAPVRGMGGVHVPSPGNADLSRAGRSSGRASRCLPRSWPLRTASRRLSLSSA